MDKLVSTPGAGGGSKDDKRQHSRSVRTPSLPIQLNGDNHEPMELDVSESDDRDDLPILDDVNLDLDSYISHYYGLPRIFRLEFIADHCKSLRIEALNAAINHIKEATYNVKDYTRLIKKLQAALEDQGEAAQLSNCQLDSAWIDTKTKQAGLRLEKLDNDLRNFRNNSMKDNIRRGLDDLGHHYLHCGDLENAFNSYAKNRDFSVVAKNQLNLCLNIIHVSVLLKRWSTVNSQVSKWISDIGWSNSDIHPADSTKIHCAIGLFELSSRRYKKAAKHFLSTNFDHFNQPNSPPSNQLPGRRPGVLMPGSSLAGPLPASSMGQISPGGQPSSSTSGSSFAVNFNAERATPNSAGQCDILAPINIAVYGSLCALATYSRQELANNLINSPSFKQFAELEPQLREAVARFHESKYAACWSILQEIKNVLLLDMYLAPHVERLYRWIKNKALIQYFAPYSAASMHRMAEAFNTNIQELESEVLTLIYEGHIKARIDSHNKILFSKNTDPRTMTFERAIKMGELWQRQTRVLIARTAILNAGLMVQNQASEVVPDRTSS